LVGDPHRGIGAAAEHVLAALEHDLALTPLEHTGEAAGGERIPQPMDLTVEGVSEAVHGADQVRVAATVPDRVTKLRDDVGEAALRDVEAGPERLVEL